MSIRLKTRWNEKDRERSPAELASALAFTLWRLSMQGVLHLENENFQTDTLQQRMDVTEEFAIFLFHVSDREAFQHLTADERASFVQSLALKLADFVQDNRSDIQGDGHYSEAFIRKLNGRLDDYAECNYDKGPGFSMVRTFGDHVSAMMGARDNQWITGYILDIETPDMIKTLQRALKSLLGWDIQST